MCVRARDKICKIFCVIKHQKYGTKNNGMTADWLPTRLPNPNSPANFIYNTQTIEKGLLRLIAKEELLIAKLLSFFPTVQTLQCDTCRQSNDLTECFIACWCFTWDWVLNNISGSQLKCMLLDSNDSSNIQKMLNIQTLNLDMLLQYVRVMLGGFSCPNCKAYMNIISQLY
mgnify:CR=1 FL=1